MPLGNIRGFALLAIVSAMLGLLVLVQEAEAGETTASFYGAELAGSPTASGEPFVPHGLSVAHKTLPLGTLVRVCNHDGKGLRLEPQRCVIARVNDRGPFVHGREFDLSLGVALLTGLFQKGVGTVDVTVL